MKINRVMIAAPKSGSGKTTVTCALLQVLKDRGEQVFSFKCGSDYIDPMFHEKVIGVPAKNLDTFFTDEQQTRRLFMESVTSNKDGFAVLEGVMGLYDGLGGIREEGSSYHLAKVTRTPIVLVADAKGMGRSVIALVAGFLSYDKAHLVQGVILNRISEGYYETLKPLMEEELGIRILGFLPDRQEFHIGSRHLGLILPDGQADEMKDIQEKLQRISGVFGQSVSIDGMIEIAEGAEELRYSEIAEGVEELRYSAKDTESVNIIRNAARQVGQSIAQRICITTQHEPVIAVARDEAFCFYYADNLRLLQEYGAQITYFSPIHDQKLPESCHGLLIGGGYPELFAEALCNNSAMRGAVRRAVESGIPVVAECGGFMYLHSAIIDKEGARREMAGVVPGTCLDTGKLVRFGYIEIVGQKGSFLPEGARIKGHEFHYYDSTDNGSDAVAVKPVTGKRYSCIMEGDTYWLGWAHLYYLSNPAFAKRFVAKAANYKEEKEHGKFVSLF